MDLKVAFMVSELRADYEAAKYFSKLAEPPPNTQEVENAKRPILKLLEEWGVEETTSVKIGAPITNKECREIASRVPKGKAAGPDRIPNEWYRAFAKPLAPLLADVFNQAREGGKLPK